MKKPNIFYPIVLCFTSFICSFLPAKMAVKTDKKLILHFDVNRTILADDPAGGKTYKDTLYHSLADTYKDIWREDLKEPISYSAYVREYLLPGKNSDQELKKLRTEKISNFIEYLRINNHHFYEKVKEEFELMNHKLSGNKSLIFDSFYKLIDYLKLKNIDFSIALRTFGHDLERVMKEINTVLGKKCFESSAKFEQGILHVQNTDELHSADQIYNFIKSNKCLGIQDNWKEWSLNNQYQEYGKAFYIDSNDDQTISIFFDDNIIEDPQSLKNIVNPVDVKTGLSLNVANLIQSKNLVVVDTIQAILDDQYFINKIKPLIKAA